MGKPTLGDRLKHARERRNLKQTQVMRYTGINNKTLSGYENNISEPDLETLRNLAVCYEVDMIDLIGSNEQQMKCRHDNKTCEFLERNNKTDSILREMVERYKLDLTNPIVREKVELLIRLVLSDHIVRQ